MHNFAEENAKRMAEANQGSQILSAGFGPPDQAMGIAGVGAGPGMVGGKPPSPDPMWMPLASLLQSYHGLRKEVDYLKIEVSHHKLRVAELEHERALRIG